MPSAPTIGDLFKAKEVSTEDIEAVARGWFEDRVEGRIPIGKHAVDIAAAVEAHEPTRDALDDDSATEGRKLMMVRTAIILAPALTA